MTPDRAAGRSLVRADAREKVTGEAAYAIDWTVPGMAHGAVVRADRAHARIVGIDKTRALKAPGVIAVVTGDDLGGLFPRFGHLVADHPILAIERVRYYGEPVALVVGETVHTATDARSLIRISYEDLPAVIDAEAALAGDAPILHEDAYVRGDASFSEALPSAGADNVAHEVTLEWGDVETAFRGAHTEVVTEMRYPMLYAYAMEPYNATATFEGDTLSVVTTAQHPFQVQADLARIFSLPLAAVQVRSPLLGGGYGSKSYTKVEPLAAVGAWVSGRPVKLVLDVEESIYTTRADSAVVRARTAFSGDGAILAREFDLVLNSGAYADNSPLVVSKAVNRCFGPYRVPNLRVRGRSVYTNTSPASSYRGFGAPQGSLAGEMNLDQGAEHLGIDPAELRRRNVLGPGEEIIPGKRPLDADLQADLDLLLEMLDYASPLPEGHGRGFGCTASDAGAFPVSTAVVRLLADGSVVVLTGSTEMGQGSRTALAQIAATELDVDFDMVRVVQGDTSRTPYERTTGASRTTTLAGEAVIRACAEVRQKVERMAAEVLDGPPGHTGTGKGAVGSEGRIPLPYVDILERWFGARAGEVTGVGVVRRSGDHSLLPPFWEIGMVGVEVSIDKETGFVEVENLVTVGDVGYAINPRLVEGQDLGAATQGLGAALWEELVYDGPQLLNANLVEYRVPRTTDMPRQMHTLLAERGDGIGPYGAKGAGEGAVNPMGGAVAAAVARAIGRWPDRLPLTPERVWRLLEQEDGH